MSLEQKIRLRANKAQRIKDNIVDEDADFEDERMGIIAGDDGMKFVATDSDPGWTDANVSNHSSDELDEDSFDEAWDSPPDPRTVGRGEAVEVVRIQVDDDDDDDHESGNRKVLYESDHNK